MPQNGERSTETLHSTAATTMAYGSYLEWKKSGMNGYKTNLAISLGGASFLLICLVYTDTLNKLPKQAARLKGCSRNYPGGALFFQTPPPPGHTWSQSPPTPQDT